MTKYLAGVLSVIAAGVLLIAYGLLAPQASATFNPSDRFGVMQVPQGYSQPAAGYVYAQPVMMPGANAPAYAVPAGMVVQQPLARPVTYEAAPVQRAAVSTTQAPRPVRTVERAPRRDWKKTAMVIGGSSATGAGVGAIVGGKKGALIGAAIGGGASTLWETTRK